MKYRQKVHNIHTDKRMPNFFSRRNKSAKRMYFRKFANQLITMIIM